MLWSLVAVLALAGVGDLASAPGGVAALSAVAVAGLLAWAVVRRIDAWRRAASGHGRGTAVPPRLRPGDEHRPPRVAVEASGRPRPRAPTSCPAAV